MEGKSLLICVGVGGVFYHGLSRLPAFLHRRGDMDVMLIDPDVVEKRNALRQWGGISVGHDKVEAAHTVLSYLTHCHHIYNIKESIESAGDITRHVVMTMHADDYEKYVVVHAPDNHMCRMAVHEGCAELYRVSGKPVVEITGGNTIKNGYAYSCIHHHSRIDGDWVDRHPDIPEEAAKEIELIAHPAPCGDMGTVEQSISSNQLTAYCVWELAEKAIIEDIYGDMCWAIDPDGDTIIWDDIYACVIE